MNKTTSTLLLGGTTLYATFAAACGMIPVKAHYNGDLHSSVVTPSEIIERRTLPEGYTPIGTVTAECARTDGDRNTAALLFDDSTCSNASLKSKLRKKAAHVGGEVLVATHCERSERNSRDLNSISISIVCEGDVARRIDVEPVAQADEATGFENSLEATSAGTGVSMGPATAQWSMLSTRISCLPYTLSAASTRGNEARWTLDVGNTKALITLTRWPDAESLAKHQQQLTTESTRRGVAYMTNGTSVLAVVTAGQDDAQPMLTELLACR